VSVAKTDGREPDRRRSRLSDLPARLVVALPGAAVVAALVWLGEGPFEALVAVVATFAGFEAARLLDPSSRTVGLASGAVSGLVVLAVALEGREALAPAISGAFGLAAIGVITRFSAGKRVPAVLAATTSLVWVGVALAHGVLLRELPDGGILVLAVLLATFVGDTFAHILGSLFGKTPLAPSISPNKSVEGLAAGVAGGTLTVVALSVIVDESWFGTADALILGLCVAVAAPLGDLWESALKREAGVKDSGTLLGAHGGVLDRVDALLFTVPLGYYLATALV
jgi:phosphatidate cytidylyltransferase